MFGSAILDVAIGLIFIYLMMSLIVTAVSELIAAWLKWRADNLAKGIQRMLNSTTDDQLAQKLYSHAIIKSLSKGVKGPSYIPSRTFTLALLDIISPADPSGPRVITDIQNKLKALPDGDVKKTLTVLLDDARHDIARFEEAIEIWFNNTMERVSGWYKRKSQIVNAILAIAVTVLANADSISIAKSLSSDPALRNSLVAEAQKFAEANANQSFSPQAPPPDSETAKLRAAEAEKKLREYREQIQNLGVPIGWNLKASDQTIETGQGGTHDPRSLPDSATGWIMKILGLLLTAIALSLGAPFWFDMLNKVINIRSAGKAPEEKQKQPKKVPTPPEPGETPREASEREDSGKG